MTRAHDRHAAWARQRLPHWAPLIDQAVRLRSLGGHRGEADHAETARFVNAVADEISRPRRQSSPGTATEQRDREHE